MTFRVLDLFCGAGGFSLGFEMAGFETSLAIDFVEPAIDTFKYNRENKVGLNIDIYEYDNERLEKFIQNQQAIIQSLKEDNEQLKKEYKIAINEMVTDYKKLEKENEQLQKELEKVKLLNESLGVVYE